MTTGPIGFKAKLLALGLALAVAFGLCETAARVMYPAPPEPVREPQLLYQSHPELGFIHVPNQAGYLDDGLATINALGLRGVEPDVPKPAGSFRVLAIGDSTTFGWGVDDDESYPARLERLLAADFPSRRPSVVNAGVGAYDLKQAARLLGHFAPVLEPDVVLVGAYWNDLPYEGVSPEGTALGRGAQPRARRPAAGRASKPFRIGNDPTSFNRFLRRSRALYVMRHAWLSAIAPTDAASNQVQWEIALLEGTRSPAVDLAWADVGNTLAEIRDLAEQGGYDVGVLIVPIRAQVEQQYPNADYQARIRQLAEAQGLFVVDPLQAFIDEPDSRSLFIPYDRMHLSAKGNALLAQAALEALGSGGHR